ncbi:MAG: 4Fe-4S binding protein [Sarcina sp.]
MTNLFKIKYLRTIFQILFYILYPGLFALTFSQIGSLIFKLTHTSGNFYSLILTILTALILLIMTAFLGRFFCGWMCSFRSMSDFLYYINKKLFKKKLIIKVPENIDFILKKIKYVVLLFILIIFWIMNIKFSFNTDPWRSFANIISLHMALLTFNFGLFLFILIVIGDFFIERFFCRYLCPLGAIFVFTSKLKFLRIKKPKDKCGKYTACTKTCSMNLNLYKVNIVKDADCINCFKCIEVCPKKNAKLSIGQKTLNTLAIISVSIISFFILYAIKKTNNKVS